MAEVTGVRMVGGVAWTSKDCWDYGINALCKAGDSMEDHEERLSSAIAGVGWIAAAIAMEHISGPDEPTGGEDG